jgi:hypothetical protein
MRSISVCSCTLFWHIYTHEEIPFGAWHIKQRQEIKERSHLIAVAQDSKDMPMSTRLPAIQVVGKVFGMTSGGEIDAM